jgi:phosphotransferase system  glucose/maltose/N-acetylglucosamine-specific IIC component
MYTHDDNLLRAFTSTRYTPPKIKYWHIGLVCVFDLLLISILYQQKTPQWCILLLAGILCLVLIATIFTVLFDRKMYKTFSEMNAFGLIEQIRNSSKKSL